MKSRLGKERHDTVTRLQSSVGRCTFIPAWATLFPVLQLVALLKAYRVLSVGIDRFSQVSRCRSFMFHVVAASCFPRVTSCRTEAREHLKLIKLYMYLTCPSSYTWQTH